MKRVSKRSRRPQPRSPLSSPCKQLKRLRGREPKARPPPQEGINGTGRENQEDGRLQDTDGKVMAQQKKERERSAICPCLDRSSFHQTHDRLAAGR